MLTDEQLDKILYRIDYDHGVPLEDREAIRDHIEHQNALLAARAEVSDHISTLLAHIEKRDALLVEAWEALKAAQDSYIIWHDLIQTSLPDSAAFAARKVNLVLAKIGGTE